jgi:hypothetical protein
VGIEWKSRKTFAEERIFKFNILENTNDDYMTNVCLFREPDPYCVLVTDIIVNVA